MRKSDLDFSKFSQNLIFSTFRIKKEETSTQIFHVIGITWEKSSLYPYNWVKCCKAESFTETLAPPATTKKLKHDDANYNLSFQKKALIADGWLDLASIGLLI